MTSASIEIIRHNISESKFRAVCRAALRKADNGLADWVGYMAECGKTEGMNFPLHINTRTGAKEICVESIGNVHLYSHDTDGYGYNFIWEWTPDSGEAALATGIGYFWCVEF